MRELGGRFLEVDDRTETYSDIGDKKATEKTSQALREGQAQTKKDNYRNEAAGMQSLGMSLSSHCSTAIKPTHHETSELGYFEYSVQVLDALYNEHENNTHTPVAKKPLTSVSTNNAAIAKALDQFSLPPAQGTVTFTDASLPIARSGGGDSSIRPTFDNMSISSRFSLGSVQELLEWALDENNLPAPEWMGGRGSMMSVQSSEVRSLFRLAEPQLKKIESMIIEDVNGRVSELRNTDVAKDFEAKLSEGVESYPRFTDFTAASLMDASLMTISREDMSFSDGNLHSSDQKQQQERTLSDDAAELLLGMSINPTPQS